MAEKSEGRPNWLANLTAVLAWFILAGGILYSIFELVFIGFWSGILLAIGVSIASLFLAIGLLTLSHILAKLASIEKALDQLQKKS